MYYKRQLLAPGKQAYMSFKFMYYCLPFMAK